MPRRTSIPSYRLHKQSGQAVVTLPDGLGNRRDVLLGPYDTPESRAEYGRVLAEWEARGRRLTPAKQAASAEAAGITVNELVLAFLKHADRHYRHADGTPTREPLDFKYALRPLCHLYGPTPATLFGPLALKAIRDLMVKGYEHPKYGPQEALSRGVTNHRINRIRRVFKWGVENELVPSSVLEGLRAVRGLQRGRTDARETEPVRPVAEAVVEETLPHALPPVAAMARLQLLTGMRPGEAVIMRGRDIDMTGAVWLYRPARHKTEHHGHQRVIALGPQAQEIVRAFLKPDIEAYLFSPKEGMAAWYAEKRRKRKTKVQPSQIDRRTKKRKRQLQDRYTVTGYALAVRKACDRAFPPPAPLAKQKGETNAAWRARLEAEGLVEELKAWQVAHRWHPHRLRHTAATKLRREYGLDVARVVLGHRSPQITELYAELDVSRAAEAMQRLG